MITVQTSRLAHGILVFLNGVEMGEVRAIEGGSIWQAVPIDQTRQSRMFDEEGRAINYVISGW